MRIKWFFIWTNLNPIQLRILCSKFGWNWPSGSGEEDFWISSMYFRYFAFISPWKYGEALNLNKLESPSLKDALCICSVWLKLAQWFWRRRFLNFFNLFRYFVIISQWKGAGPLHLEQTWIPYTQGCIVSSMVKIGPVVLEKKSFEIRQCIFSILEKIFKFCQRIFAFS